MKDNKTIFSRKGFFKTIAGIAASMVILPKIATGNAGQASQTLIRQSDEVAFNESKVVFCDYCKGVKGPGGPPGVLVCSEYELGHLTWADDKREKIIWVSGADPAFKDSTIHTFKLDKSKNHFMLKRQ